MVKLGAQVLQSLYKGHWDSSLDVNIHNIRTKHVGQTHHCSICKGKAKAVCYRELHFSFCIALIDVKGKADICGERFCPKSQDGCGTHHYKNGFNQIIKDHWKEKKSIVEALEELRLAEEAEKLALEAKVPEHNPDLSYQEYNQRNKNKELATRRDRHAAMTQARAALNAKGNTKGGNRLGTKAGSKWAKGIDSVLDSN